MQSKMKKIFRRVGSVSAILTIVLVAFFAAANAEAAWKKEGVEINKGGLDNPYAYEERETVISDKSGVIFVYTANKNYYIQKINGQAEKKWGEKGVVIFKAAESMDPNIISDGFGGVIITFNEHNKIYAQRINKWGKKQWGSKGILIATGKKGSNPLPVIISDKKAGAIIGWHDDLEFGAGIYVARVDYQGNVLWKKSGKEIFKDRSQGDIKMVSDKKGYIYINNQGAYLQKIDRNGQVLWSAAGIEIMPSFKGRGGYKMIYNSKDGIIIVGNKKNQREDKLFAQKIDFNGKLKWLKEGVPVSDYTFKGKNVDYGVVSDGKGGVAIAWVDTRIDVYAQRINSQGKRVWGKNDKVITATPDSENSVQIILSSKKEIIIDWNSVGHHFQKINKQGVLQWGKKGLVLQNLYSPLIREVNKELIVLATRYVVKKGYYIYAYKIDKDGNILGD